MAHRVVWYLYHGKDPGGKQIDHINGNPQDNRIVNLRLCEARDNQANAKVRKDNTSGYKGVIYYKRFDKWMAQITRMGKHVILGYFSTKEEAATAYMKAAEEIQGAYALHLSRP